MSEDSPNAPATEDLTEGTRERAEMLDATKVVTTSHARAPTALQADAASADALTAALWARVLEAWDDDKPHRAILEHALRTETLPTLAGLYRSLEADPEKSARAKKKMDGIVIAATQMLFATKTPARTKTPWQWTASVAVVCLFVMAWLTYRIFVHR